MMTTLPTTFDDNNTSLIYTSKRLKLNFCGNSLVDDSTLIYSSSWQQCKFRGNALNNVASLIYASNRLKFNFCGNALDDDSTLIHSSSWQQCKFRGSASNNVASLIYASKRQKPTAQGNTLGKHACVDLRPVRQKHYTSKHYACFCPYRTSPRSPTLPGVLPRAVRYCPCGAQIFNAFHLG